MKISENKIRAYALKNAIHYKGKANPGAVVSGLFAEGLQKEEIKEIMPKIQKVIQEISKLSLEEQKVLFEKHKDEVSERDVREGLPEIPHTEKGIITRFAPAPSGQLHVGHFISNVLPYLFVKKYGGKFYVRIEDTNPEKTDPAAYEGIKDDCNWVYKGGVNEFIIQSDRMKIYYDYVKKLIDTKFAYVCICDPEKFKEYVQNKKPCPCRKKTINQNIKDWEKMLDKKGFKEGEAVLRFKTPTKEGGMKNSNPAMRDFPLARINETEHPRQKHKYRVWPLMHLAVPIDDIEYKMTHVIRAKEHMDNAKRQKMIYNALGKEKLFPWTFFMGRIKFTDLNLGKRFIKAAIEAGEYSGWDDEKLPTIKSLRKKGYKPETFWKLAEHRGLTEVDKVMNSKDFFEMLDKFNKEAGNENKN